MLKQKITVLVQTTVAGPSGFKLMPGKVVEFEDSDYIRLLVKSETVTLVDPPSLDPDFLEKGGYELQDGYSYDELRSVIEEDEPKKAGKIVMVPKSVEPLVTLEPIDSEEQHSDVALEESPQETGDTE